MLSRQIDLAALQAGQKETLHQKKRPSAFNKIKRRKPISREVERGSLQALKKMLAQQKTQNSATGALSIASPFSEFASMQQINEQATISKIEVSSQVMQLYDKLIDSLVHIHQEGISETTLFLDGDAFSSSIFQGSKITITEYSTAPKIFNIQFTADSEALALFEAHAGQLQNAFQKGNFNFDINRIDTSLLTRNEKHALKPVTRDREDDTNE